HAIHCATATEVSLLEHHYSDSVSYVKPNPFSHSYLCALVCYRPLCSSKASSSSCYTKSHVDTTSTCYLFCIIISDPSSQSSAILYDLISLLRDARHIQAR